jgi:hypothetical protein
MKEQIVSAYGIQAASERLHGPSARMARVDTGAGPRVQNLISAPGYADVRTKILDRSARLVDAVSR